MQVLDCCIVMVKVPVAMMLKVPSLLALGDKKIKILKVSSLIIRLVYYLWESFFNHEEMVIYLWERFFNHEEVVWILIQCVWSDACKLRTWAVSKNKPTQISHMVLWLLCSCFYCSTQCSDCSEAVSNNSFVMVVYFLVPTSEFTLHTPGVYKGCHNDGKVKVTTSKRCSGMLSRVSTCERASWTQLLTPFEAYGQPGHWKVPVSSCWWSHTWIYPCYGYNLHRSTGHWKLLWSLNFLDTG